MIHYSKQEDHLNALTHAAALVGGATVVALLMARCMAAGAHLAATGLALYLLGLVWSYGASTVYHAWPTTQPLCRERLRMADHIAIYWHIAGSYSAVTLATIPCSGATGWALFAFVWAAALAGTAVSLRGVSEHSYIETACFCLMGLSVLAVFPVFLRCVGWTAMAWMLAEGVFYIAGAVVYAVSPNRPYMHTLFHVFTLAGTACHLISLVYVLENTIFCTTH